MRVAVLRSANPFFWNPTREVSKKKQSKVHAQHHYLNVFTFVPPCGDWERVYECVDVRCVVKIVDSCDDTDPTVTVQRD